MLFHTCPRCDAPFQSGEVLTLGCPKCEQELKGMREQETKVFRLHLASEHGLSISPLLSLPRIKDLHVRLHQLDEAGVFRHLDHKVEDQHFSLYVAEWILQHRSEYSLAEIPHQNSRKTTEGMMAANRIES